MIAGRLLALLKPHWRMVLLGTLLSLLALAANVGLTALSSWFITSMALAGWLGVTMEYTLPAAVVRALALARAATRYLERLANHDTTLRILTTIRVWFYRRVEPLAPARLAAHRGGDLLSRIRADVDTLDDFYVRGVVPAVVATLATVIFTAVLFRFDPRLALVDAAALATAGLLVPLLLRRLAREPGRARVELAASLRSSVVEEAQGMAELIALGAVDAHAARLGETAGRLERVQRRLASLQGVGEAAFTASATLALWGALLILVPAVEASTIAPELLPTLAVFVLASFEAVLPLPGVIQRAGELGAASRRLFELADAPPAVDEPRIPASWRPTPGRATGLSIRDLRFRYGPGEPWIYDGLSLQIAPGERLAIVGRTGAGKSTLINILMRFWEYEGGSVRVGSPGVELRTLPGSEARRLFSVLPQAPHLFHASLGENLALALPEEEGTEPQGRVEARFREALEIAQLGPLLADLPKGLDTTVGETGKELSAGEVRRVALARALLRDAGVYILDEPTESLDEPTADALLVAVTRRLEGRTLLLLTHRERDLRHVDRVVRIGDDAV